MNSDEIGVITSDFSGSGRFYTMNTQANFLLNYIPIYSDATGTYIENSVYIINRLGRDTIQILDPNFFYLLKGEFTTGKNTNPHGIATYKDKAYITLYDKNYLLVVDKITGLELKKIDLSIFAETQNELFPDGLPESSGIIEFNQKIYVALQRLDRSSIEYVFPPTDFSLLIEIDPSLDTIQYVHQFLFKNPISKLKIYNIFGEECIYVANAGYLGFNFRIDGGIEGFCPQSYNQHTILKEDKVGGDIMDFVILNSSKGYALVSFSDFSNQVVEFNPQNGEINKEIIFYKNQEGFSAGLEVDNRGMLYIGESSNYPVIRIYNTNLDTFESIVPLPQRPTEIFRIR
ncbi:MAG: hypothetical protein ACK4UJ_03470 [Leptonema sp. (in: bacteria)]